MSKVSIIVPVYNMELKLNRCLDSLVNQTLKSIEIIIINDGSNDNSIKIINQYKEKYSFIKVVSRENKGISYTRNEGIKLSTSDYIAFVDSDDYIELDMFEKLYSAITSKNYDIAICNYKMLNESSNEIIYKNISENCKITNLYDNPKMIYKMDYSPWNKLYKKELWNGIYYPENLKYEDLEAVLKVFLKTDKIIYVGEYLYNYFINPSGETSTINERIFDIFSILDNLSIAFNNEPKELKRAFQELCISKIFIYNHFILNTKNRNFSKVFMKKGYDYIKNNFKCWKFKYILNSKNLKNFIMRIIQTNKFIYYKYIDYRTCGDSHE